MLRARVVLTNRDLKDRTQTKVMVSSFTYTIVDFDLSSGLMERDRQVVRLFAASASPRHADAIVVDCSRHLRDLTRGNRQTLRDLVKVFLQTIREFAQFFCARGLMKQPNSGRTELRAGIRRSALVFPPHAPTLGRGSSSGCRV